MRLITDDMIEAAVAWLNSNSDDISQARGAVIRSDYRAKKVLAKQMLAAEGPEWQRRARATCSDDYEKAMDDVAGAEERWEGLKDKRNKLELLCEAWRTQNANERGIVRAAR